MTQRLSLPAAGIVAIAALTGCTSDPNSPGLEYMPDMYRSPAVEAYVDYGQDPYYFDNDSVVAQRNTQSAKLPPEGTIPFSSDPAKAQFNFPYPYPNTPEGYELAGVEVKSPIAMTAATVEQGKVIYGKFCVHCHGDKGMGDGKVVSVGNHPPPQAYNGPLKDLSEGKMFHTLTHGKGMMGSHASQLTKEERWLVIQYVKYLQANEKMPGEATPADTATTASAAATTTK